MIELRAKSTPFSSDILQILSGKNFFAFCSLPEDRDASWTTMGPCA